MEKILWTLVVKIKIKKMAKQRTSSGVEEGEGLAN
jgi:hypothetical protein